MQIVILDGYSVNPGDLSWSWLEQFGTVSVYDRTPQELVKQRMLGADVVLTNKCRIGAQELERANRLKYIGELATGYDGIDLTTAREHGIAVTNIPAYSTESVAQHEMALLLEIALHVGHHSTEVQRGRWTASPDFCFWDTPLIELSGLTFGIIGCGKIGCAVAKLAAAFNMRILGYSRGEHPAFPGERADLDTLLRTSDIIALHCPSNAETRGMIDTEAIGKMKPGTILLNTARGDIVDPIAVADALKNGRLYGYGTDVASPEPITRSNPLLGLENCVITPHIAWAPLAARKRLMMIAKQNLSAFFAGERLNRVD